MNRKRADFKREVVAEAGGIESLVVLLVPLVIIFEEFRAARFPSIHVTHIARGSGCVQ